MRRNDFLKVGGILAATASQTSLYGASMPRTGTPNASIDFLHDGLALSPKEYASLLMKLADEGKIKPDYYSNGGVVEELETKFASLLGKESAVFMPTGTLANHIAVRHLAGPNRRVIVQEQSHLYNDSGDCSQTLSGLTLLPLGANAIEFSVDEVDSIVNKTQAGRVATRIGVLSIESPVRRQKDQVFRYDTVRQVAEYAKTRDIKMHLDGARLFVQPVHTGVSVIDYGAPFDTIYTSLWKCFNAASGAILAGSKSFTTNLFHERRLFGGGLPTAWAFAAVALYYADTFADEYKQAWANAQRLFALLQKDERFTVTPFEHGSHIVELTLKSANPMRFKEALAKTNTELPMPANNSFLLKVNPSLNRETPQHLAGRFMEAIG